MLADTDACEAAMFERIASAEPVEAIGVVESIVGFGDFDHKSLSIELRPWRWAGGTIEEGGLYVRKLDIIEGELRRVRNEMPELSVIRLLVRPDTCRRESGDLWDAGFEEVVSGIPDEELEALAKKLREQRPPDKLGRPDFDFWWWFLNVLGRFLPEPTLQVVHIGLPRPEGNWWPEKERSIFEGCEEWVWNTESGTIRVGILNEKVEGVLYDLEIYRGSGSHRMKKLQTLLKAHGTEREEICRIMDTQHGGMLYRTVSNSRFAIYAYLVDWFIVHSNKTSYQSQ